MFVISQLVDFAMEIGDIFLKGAKAQVLEQMAYIDDMTGVANRRRCEEMWDRKLSTAYGFSTMMITLSMIQESFTEGQTKSCMRIN